MASFGNLLDSFDKVVLRLDLEIQTGKDYLDWFKRRSRMELDYAKSVAEYCRAPPGNSKAPAVLKIERTMREGLLSLTESGIKVAERHAEVAKRIGEDIAKPLEAFLKQSESEKKRLQNEGEKKLKALKDLHSSAAKAHENYEKLSKDAEAAREAAAKAARDAAAAPDNKKLAPLVPKAEANKKQKEDKAAVADTAYQAAVKAHNDAQQKLYSEELPRIMSEFQKLFEDNFRALEKALQNFLESQKPFPEKYTEVVELLNQKVTKEVSFDTDLKELVDSLSSGKNPIVPIEYVPFPTKPIEEPGALKSEVPAAAPAPVAAAPVAAAPVAAAPAEETPAAEPAAEPAAAPATETPAEAAPATASDPLSS